jgi:hypothetical protein
LLSGTVCECLATRRNYGNGNTKARQEQLRVATDALARGGGHAFYGRVNAIFEEHRFDAFAEEEKKNVPVFIRVK